jgi:MoaA/NifB/PqqE/SkfB family radical SAM enzyme
MNKAVPEKLTEEIYKSRERLKQKKPKVYTKLMNYLEAEKRQDPFAISLIDFALGFKCNFECTHCCADAFSNSRKSNDSYQMSIEQVKHMADQADEVGAFIINLIGGEPLVWNGLEKVIEAIDPSRFHISMTTNGWFLTPEIAQNLAKWGVDKIGISIDSGFAEEHDEFRKKKGSFERAIEGIRNAKAAGIRVIVSTVVTHQNIYQPGFQKLVEITEKLGVSLDLQCATVAGSWQGNTESLLNEKDAAYLDDLRQKHPLLRRDLWSAPGSKGGCPAVKRSVYIIPDGNVLPCLFIHISLGNIFNEPLREIIERGLNVDALREPNGKCLAGEDMNFINKYLTRTYSAKLPLTYEDGFSKNKDFPE